MKRSKRVSGFRFVSAGLMVFTLVFAGSQIQMGRAQAQGGVSLTAQVGLDGYCKTGSWIPVRLNLENTGADVDGRVQVSYLNRDDGQSVFGQDILLPTNSRKELFLYFIAAGIIRSPKVELIERGRTVARADIKVSCLDAPNLLFGVLADDAAPYDVLSAVRPLRGLLTCT